MATKFITVKLKQDFFEGLLDQHFQAAIPIGFEVAIREHYYQEQHYLLMQAPLKYVESTRDCHYWDHHLLFGCSDYLLLHAHCFMLLRPQPAIKPLSISTLFVLHCFTGESKAVFASSASFPTF